MKRLLIFLLFATSAAARTHDYTLHAPKIPPFHAIKVTPLVFAQTNTFCPINLNCTITGIWTFTNTVNSTNLNSVQWAGPGATQTIDQAVTACGANPCTIMISSTYSGPESVNLTFNATDGATYNIYRGSNNITIHDLRASTNKAYGINYGGITLGSLARFAVTQSIATPTTTTSAGLFTQQVVGTPTPGGAMATVTAELDTEGALSGTINNIYQVVAGQFAIRSTGGTISIITGVEGGGGIDRTTPTTNINTAASIQGDQITNISSSGATVTDAFSGRFLNQTVGTRNNMSIYSQGNMMFGNSQCIYSEFGSLAALKNVCFANQTGVGGVSIWGQNAGAIGARLQFMDVQATHTNWMIASQQNVSNSLEFTPSTAVGGTTFTTPQMLINTPGATTAVTIQNSSASGTGLRITPGADANNAIIWTNAANSVNAMEADGLGHQLWQETTAALGVASKGAVQFDSADHFLDYNPNNQGLQRAPQVLVLTSQYTNSTTGFTNVTGGNTISWPVAASRNYTATCHLYYQSAATGGLNIEFTGPAAPTAVHYGLLLPVTTGTAPISTEADAFSGSLGAVVGTAATNFDATVSFSLVNGVNAGTVNLLAKSSAAAQLQIQIGSFCRVQ
jgi:hypothetical protein